MNTKLAVQGVFGLAFTMSSLAFAAIPDLIPVQGSVGDADDKPLDGKTNMAFEIYDAAEDGDLLHRSVYNNETMQVHVDKGFFTVYLGELDEYPIDFTELLTASQLWLQIEVNGEVLDSRIRLASVPFAQQARTCEQIGDLQEADIQPAIGEACENGQFLRGWDNEENQPICGADKISQDASAVANWEEMINIPEEFADGKDDGFTSEGELTALLDDNYIGKSQADSITSGMITDGTIGAADVDSTAIQLRGSTSSCEAGMYVTGIDDDGNVSCEPDQNTQASYTAGTGLSLDEKTFSVKPADLFSVPVHVSSNGGSSLGQGSYDDLISATINLKTPGWVVAMGMASLAVTEQIGSTAETFLCISTSSNGSCVADSKSGLRPQIHAAPGGGYYQQHSQTTLYFDTIGEKTIYLLGHGEDDDTVVAYHRHLTLFSIPAAQTE